MSVTCVEAGSPAEAAALLRQAEFILLKKTGVQLSDEARTALENEAAADHGAAALFARVLPYGQERHFDPVTLELEIAEPDCVLLRTDALKAAGGFDPRLTGAAAAADLCWRLRTIGCKLRYCPHITVWDETAGTADTLADYTAAVTSDCILRAKYGAFGKALRLLADTLRTPRHFPGVRRALVKALPHTLADILCAALLPAPAAARQLAALDTPGYGPARGRCALEKAALEAIYAQQPLVSIVMRTCGRPDTLRETLRSLRHQLYRNFEVVITEDGAATAQQMLTEEFADLPIRYTATGQKVGRGRAGNLSIEAARGEYAVFLDDDDFFYPDLIEQALAAFLRQPDTDLILLGSMALQCDVLSRSPYIKKLHRVEPVLFDHITRMDMCVKCRVPISGAMFRRSLYALCGGMREDIDADEDWAMWLRYLGRARRPQQRAPDIPRALSACLYPADPAEAARRHAAYAVYDEQMLADPALLFECTPEEMADWRATVAADIAHLRLTGGLEELRAQAQQHEAADIGCTDTVRTLSALQINRYYWHLVRCGCIS